LIVSQHDLPTHDLMLLHYYGDESSWPRKLWDVAERSVVGPPTTVFETNSADEDCIQSLSGRTLHRLPLLSLAKYSMQDPCPMDQALEALSKAVDNELLTQQRIRIDQEEGSENGSGRRLVLFA